MSPEQLIAIKERKDVRKDENEWCAYGHHEVIEEANTDIEALLAEVEKLASFALECCSCGCCGCDQPEAHDYAAALLGKERW